MHALIVQAHALGGLNVEDSFFTLHGITSLAAYTTSTYYWFFWVNLFKPQNKLISHGIGSHDLQDPYFKRRIRGPHFLFINWDHNPMTSSTSTYGSGSNNESKVTAHISSLTLMASDFSNNPYLHKMTTKPKVCHLIFSLWSKLMSLFGDTLGVVVWMAKRYVQ